MSLKLIFRTKNGKAGIFSYSLRFNSFSAKGPSSHQNLFGVTNGGKFYKRSPPQDENDSWLGSAQQIGSDGWDSFQHLFFHPDGTLYGVLDRQLYKGLPQTVPNQSPTDGATIIGSGGWEVFQFLFFDPPWRSVWGNRWKALQRRSTKTPLL